MKPRQVLGKYFEVYGQGSPITPEAREKKAPFFYRFFANFFIIMLSVIFEYFNAIIF